MADSIFTVFKAQLDRRVLVLDGALGTMIQQYNLAESDFRGNLFGDVSQQIKGDNDVLNLTRPDVITEIHEKYLKAGADIIETNTFNATSVSQADYGMQAHVREMNLAGARLARKLADSYSTPEKPRFVAGSVGPTNKTCSMSPDVNDPAFRSLTFTDLQQAYTEQMTALIEGGVDVLLIETIFDTLNAKAAIFAAEKAMKAMGKKVPLMLSVTVSDVGGRTLSGQTLDAFLASKKTAEEEEEVEPLFKYDFIGELNRMYNTLHNNMRFLTNLDGFITKAIFFNFEQHAKIDKISANIEREEESKKKILAQTEGLSEDQLVSAYYEITEWWKGRMQAERSSEYLSTQIGQHEKTLAQYREEYSKISEESSAAMYARSSQAILKILNAFSAAKQANKRDFLNQLETAANEYLAELNKGDFRGTARIIEKPDDSAEIILVDVDGTRVYNPNTALKTTMYMSLLFAVAKLTTIKHENDYPLIFDAPTSSFTGSKEGDFFSVIGNIQKQTIIVTKSFLTEKENSLGESLLDKPKIDKINATKYRLKLKRPFVEEDLSTIQTVIEDI